MDPEAADTAPDPKLGRGPESEPGRAPKRGRRTLAAAAAVLAVGAAYVAASALVPLPAPTLTLEVPATARHAVDGAPVQEIVDAEQQPTAVGWLDGDDVWANDDEAHPLASITKLVTVLVGQEAAPLALGEDGPSYTWTEADVEFQAELAELDGIAYPIPVGTDVTRRQLLTLALVPSANDFATAYARSVFGDNDAFVAAAADWAEREGLDSLRVTEPSGMDDGNVASAADVVLLARLILFDPVLTEIVDTETASFPWGIGEVENTNPLLGTLPDAVGVKTGHTDTAGYSLAAAANGELGGRELTRIAVVLGRDSLDEREDDARDLLSRLATFPEEHEVTEEGEYLGTLTSADGQFVEVSVDDTYSEVLIPGEVITRAVQTTAAEESVIVAGPQGARHIAVVREGTFAEPSLWWRLTHPHVLFTG